MSQQHPDLDIDELLNESNNVSPKNDVQILIKAWVAERTAPELLPYENFTIERLLDRVQQQIKFIETETGRDSATNFRLVIVQTELERIKYIIRSYLRARLFKLDKHLQYILDDPSQSSRLSDDERDYATKHLALIDRHYHDAFLRDLPENLQRTNDATGGISMIEEPDLDRAVFCKVVKQPVDTMLDLGNDESISLTMDSIYLVRYSVVRELIMDGSIELI